MGEEISIEQFERALLEPGRILAFFDESELSVHDSPVDLFGGVIMRSEELNRPGFPGGSKWREWDHGSKGQISKRGPRAGRPTGA